MTSLHDRGPGTLRQALADAAPGDAITFEARGTISVESPLTVARDVAIIGPDYSPDGLPQVQLSGAERTSVLVVASGASARIENLSVRSGSGDPDTAEAGGVTNHGTLVLSRCWLTDNAGYYGGAVRSDGDLSVIGSTIARNRSDSDAGGIVAHRPGELVLRSSHVEDNAGGYKGGAIAVVGNGLVEDCVIAGNSATVGAGIYAGGGTLTVRRTRLERNAAAGSGGGVYGEGQVVIEDSSIMDNPPGEEVPWDGGGIYLSRGLVVRSLIANNRAHQGAGIYAREPLTGAGFVQVANTTVSGNTAVAYDPGRGEAFAGAGGGLYVSTTTLLVNSTIVDNVAQPGSTEPARGAGIAAVVTPTLVNDIVAGNGKQNCDKPVYDGGHNLQYPGASCGATIASTDPLLDGWTDDPRPGRRPGPGSPAIGAGELLACSMVPVLGVDQRGFARPTDPGARCDIGAIETGSATTPTPGFTPAVTATPPLPDLIPSGLAYGPSTGGRCVGPDTRWRLFVGLANRGLSPAGAFQVSVDGTPYPHAALAPGAADALSLDLGPQEHTVVVDPGHEIAELREDNNTYAGRPVIGTSPPPCTPTPGETPQTPTPASPPTLLAPTVTVTATAPPTRLFLPRTDR